MHIQIWSLPDLKKLRYTMQNKKQKLVWILQLVAFCWVIAPTKAGESTPYAQYGLGLLGDNNYVPSSSIGGLGAAYRSSEGLNFNNPASLSAISLTSFEVGVQGYLGSRKINSGSAAIGGAGLDYMSIAFPVISKRWGMGIGLIPYSSKNSYSSDSISFGNQNGVIHNENNGSLYNFFWSNGVSYKDISVGFSLAYLFGNLSNNSLAYSLKDNILDYYGYGTWYYNTLQVRSLYMNFGAQYHKNFRYGSENKKNLKLTIGVSGAPGYKLGKRSSIDEATLFVDTKYLGSKSDAQSYKDYLSDIYASYGSAFDTLSLSQGQATEVHVPGYIQAGFTLADSNRWLAGFDFRYQPWSKYSGYGIRDGITLQNSWRVGLGGEILPSTKPDARFFSKIKYRTGFFYERTNLQFSSNPINEFGINVGFGIPIIVRLYDEYNTRRFVYAFNLSIEAGSRGTLNNNLIRENFARLKFGVNLNSAWFQKRKYY